MASGVSITIEGLPELKTKFAQLSDKQQRGVLRTAIRAGANLVVREARKRAPVQSGALRKGIKAKVSVKQNGGAEAEIGWDNKIAPHGHLVEMGHVQVVVTRGKRRTVGHVPARPFIRPALIDNQQEIIDLIAKNFKKHIDKVAAGQGASAASDVSEAA